MAIFPAQDPVKPSGRPENNALVAPVVAKLIVEMGLLTQTV